VVDLTEDDVQKILRLVDELDYGEIHLQIGALRIDLVKTPAEERSHTPPAPTAASQPASRTKPASRTQPSPPHAASDDKVRGP
jgi:hypothetical protein